MYIHWGGLNYNAVITCYIWFIVHKALILTLWPSAEMCIDLFSKSSSKTELYIQTKGWGVYSNPGLRKFHGLPKVSASRLWIWHQNMNFPELTALAINLISLPLDSRITTPSFTTSYNGCICGKPMVSTICVPSHYYNLICV